MKTASLAAQISNLLYRRFPIGRTFGISRRLTSGRSGSGLATRDTAGWQPALRAASARLLAAVLSTLLAAGVFADGVRDGLSNTVMLSDSARGSTVAVYDQPSGMLTLARGLNQANQSDHEFIYVPVRRFGIVEGSLIRAADLNGDGLLDLILPAHSANRLLVLWGDSLDDREIVLDEIFTGAGPAAVGPARLERASEAHQVLVAHTARARVEVRGWDLARKEPVTSAAFFPEGFAQEGLFGFETAASSRGAIDPNLGILLRDARGGINPLLEIFARNPGYGPENSIHSWESGAAHQRLISGFPAGEGNPGWFLAYAPGSELVEMFPSSPGQSELIDLGDPVSQVQFLPGIDDEVLVAFADGGLAIYDFAPGAGFALKQDFEPPPGLQFATAAGGGGNFTALLSDASGQLAQFNVFEKGPNGYQLINQGGWPVLPMMDGGVTVVLYTGNPFSTPQPFPFETFIAGHWASDVFFGQGTISALVETFGGTTQGLGNPSQQALQPAADPGPGGAALGNQWEPSSSLFYLAPGAAAGGQAAVLINPPSGKFPTTIGVTFQTGEDVTVFYRVNQNPWQSGLGPLWITQNATVQYYGEHVSGALSSIQSAVYQINQSLAADLDGDGVPDVIEDLAGLNPFNPDSNGNGISDFNQLLFGDPDDPDSVPSQLAQPFNLVKVAVVWDDPESAALPSAGQPLSVGDLFNHNLGTGEAKTNPGSRTYENITLRRGLTDDNSALAKFWFPANFAIGAGQEAGAVGPAMTAFGGIPAAPPPFIPVDLNAPDPLEAWRQAALEAIEGHADTVFEFTIGPSSTMAALLFEHWYGARLVELGRLTSLNDRPRLADTPRSVRAGILTREDVVAIQTPSGANLIAHELAQVVQQINSAVLTGEDFQPLRETAEAFYSQAIAAARVETPLDPPLDALRQALSGTAPEGYDLPVEVETLTALRDQVLTLVTPRGVIALSGELSLSGDHLVLLANGQRYILRDRAGRPYRLDGAGLIVNGATAFVTGVPVPSNDVAMEELILAVESIDLGSVPTARDTDILGTGLPDSWKLAFLGSLDFDFWDDINGNGFVLGEEYAASIDPLDPSVTPPGAPAIPPNFGLRFDALGNPRLEWDGSFLADYDVWISTALPDWEPYAALVQREGDREHSVGIDLDEPQAFFRLGIRLNVPEP